MSTQDHRADDAPLHTQLAQDILGGILDPLLTLDSNLRISTANPAFYKTFDLTPEQTLGKSIYQVGHGMWDIDKLHDLLHEVCEARSRLYRFRSHSRLQIDRPPHHAPQCQQAHRYSRWHGEYPPRHEEHHLAQGGRGKTSPQ